MGFRYDEQTGTIDITGRALGTTRKFRNVAANGAVALVVDDLVSRNPWTVRGLEIRGHAEALVDQAPTSSYTSSEIIRVYPHRVISWGIGPEPGMHGRDVNSAAASAQPPPPATGDSYVKENGMTTGSGRRTYPARTVRRPA